MPARSAPQGAPPPPSVASLSGALAVLGIYATVPSPEELQRQAEAVGGDDVLAAVLANALYGAAIGLAMLAEGHMLDRGGTGDALVLAREQVLKSSGAQGPAVMGMMHWQAAQVAGPLRGWARGGRLGPMGDAVAAAAWGLMLVLEACTVTDVDDERFPRLSGMVTEALEHLQAAQEHLAGILDTAVDIASLLFPLGPDGPGRS